MSKKLYKVQLEYTIFVMAESEKEAENESEYYVKEDGGDIADLVSATEVKTLDDISQEWLNSLPFGSGKNLTCKQIWQLNLKDIQTK